MNTIIGRDHIKNRTKKLRRIAGTVNSGFFRISASIETGEVEMWSRFHCTSEYAHPDKFLN